MSALDATDLRQPMFGRGRTYDVTRDDVKNFGKGAVASVFGLPADIANLVFRDAPRAIASPFIDIFGGRKPEPLARFEDRFGTSDNLAKRMGADMSSPATQAGLFGVPGAEDLAKKGAMGLLENPALAMTLFHGTPHKFDRFKWGDDVRGKGEGAQAFGDGLYFAESPDVANQYMTKLARPVVEPTGYRNVDVVLETQYGGDWEKFKRAHADENPGSALAQAIKDIDSRGGPKVSQTGHLYEVDIPDEVADQMLDWDAPLSEQPESVRDILTRWQKQVGGSISDGEGALREIAFQRRMDGLDDSPAAVSQQLREMGIPGIRFFDGQSRRVPSTPGDLMDAAKKAGYDDIHAYSRDVAAGIVDPPSRTRNVVLFDPDLIREVKRDGEVVFKRDR